jgi:tetratricopeptide (TPR) repeat protein
VIFAGLFVLYPCQAQDFTSRSISKNLASLNEFPVPPPDRQLQLLYEWKYKSDHLGLPQDSVYARLLHKIGALEFLVNRNYSLAIGFTLGAVQINTSGNPAASETSALTDVYNLAFFYNKMNLFRKALLYYDQAILLARNAADVDNVMADSRLDKAYIFFRIGDYEKAIDESDLGIASALKRNDSLHYLKFLNQRAQALFFQDKLQSALTDVQTALHLATALNEHFELASAFKTRGFILGKKGEFSMAIISFRKCLTERAKTREYWQLSGDYNDLGNLYSDSMKAYMLAAACYTTAIRYAKKEHDSTRIARALLNLGHNYFYQRQYYRTARCYRLVMHYLKIDKGPDLFINPSYAELSAIGNKELVQVLFNSQTELLLGLYKVSHDNKWLTACLQTARLNDSLIVGIRHELLGEQSKLYWRDKTREFFTNAIEACYFARNPGLAFYFMEKSRSVLLQDKLNELGASAFLPPDEAARQEQLQLTITELQEKMGLFSAVSVPYKALRIKLIEARENLESFIRSLERQYPAYYQYKYADEVRTLSSLQHLLSIKKQCFIDYYIEDPLGFALCVSPDTTYFIKIDNGGRNMEGLLTAFIRSCSDERAMNKGLHGFLVNANDIYTMLLRPFPLPGKSLIICQDNHVVPFEALSRDSAKADFLINYYSFSYVYSARSLINQYEHNAEKGDFLGLAPVNFQAYKGLPDLDLSEDALSHCSDWYHRTKLFVHKEASRKNFLEQLSHYTVTTILTHARADSADEEPLLFMNDSVIHLSELKILNKPATRLIILSACETNVGRNLNGEGVFSLARGFSAAGIPAVAATLWQTDEQATYRISEKFNEYLSQGLDKAEALQKAKIFYMFSRKGSILPYYWADMVLIGDTTPIQLSTGYGTNWRIPAIFLFITVMLTMLYYLRRRIKRAAVSE